MRFRFTTLWVLLILAMTATYAMSAPIHDAAGKGDLAKVKALQRANPKLVNLTDKDGATPLHYAVAGNRKAVVEFLLAGKAHVNAKKKNGVTPLHVAAALGLTEIAKVLLSKGADPKAVDSEGRTPLTLAESNGHSDILGLLGGSSAGADAVKTITPGAKIGETSINPKDGAEMVWVPAGNFMMGDEDDNGGNKHQHTVYLDGYWMYKYEVTVAQYRKFCSDTGRDMPEAPEWGWIDDHPIVNVKWQDAVDYTKWAGVSLPTEAQWEKAARGADGRTYPWGNKWDASKCANSVKKKLNGTKPVGSYPSGASPYGCMDTAGNVCEWCSDWYSQDYYKNAPLRNPPGPADGNARVLRGGMWFDHDDDSPFLCAYRTYDDPVSVADYCGFRCTKTP